MDAFESVIASIFEREDFWVRTSYKVSLEKEDKAKIGKPSCPRWEIDIVAYCPRENNLKVIECKSYLDSHGVKIAAFVPGSNGANKYKLFTDSTIWNVVRKRLVLQMFNQKLLTDKKPSVQLCLVAGNIYGKDNEPKMAQLFEEKGWQLYGPTWIHDQLIKLSNDKYENSIASMTSKLLKRVHTQ